MGGQSKPEFCFDPEFLEQFGLLMNADLHIGFDLLFSTYRNKEEKWRCCKHAPALR